MTSIGPAIVFATMVWLDAWLMENRGTSKYENQGPVAVIIVAALFLTLIGFIKDLLH